MFRLRPRPLLISVALAAAGVLAACGSDDAVRPATTATPMDPAAAGATDLTVALTNWDIEPSAMVVRAGTVRVTATHPEEHAGHGDGEAGEVHQLIVARLDGSRSGEGRFGRPLLNLSDIRMGEAKSGEVVLEPGVYELACLVVEEEHGRPVNHYEKGMHAVITVQ